MVRTHKRSKFTHCQVCDGGLWIWENRGGYTRWYSFREYVLQTELLNDNKNCLVEYLEEKDADEYANEKRYRDEIEDLKVKLETANTKLEVVEKAFADEKARREWVESENINLGRLLEEVRQKEEK